MGRDKTNNKTINKIVYYGYFIEKAFNNKCYQDNGNRYEIN